MHKTPRFLLLAGGLALILWFFLSLSPDRPTTYGSRSSTTADSDDRSLEDGRAATDEPTEITRDRLDRMIQKKAARF